MNTDNTQHIIDELEAIEQFSASKTFPAMQDKIRQLDKSKRRKRILLFTSSIASTAAIILLVLMLQVSSIEINNDSNSPLSHLLPDGSTVELNKDAELKYAKGFSRGRKIKLSGEAFFDIVSDVDNPFSISVGKSKVKVLGTSFNVKHNLKSNKVEVFVKSGRVLLSNNDTYALELTAKQYGVANGSSLKLESMEDINYMAWKDHKLTFEDSQLPYIIKTLEESYHIDITLANKDLSDLLLSTTFHQLTIDEIITSICLTLNLKHQKTEEGFVLSQK